MTATDGTATEGVARASAIMAAGTLVSRVLGFARTVVFTAALGTALLSSTYNVANTIPNILYILLAGGVLNAVFVPQLVRAMKQEPTADGERPGDAYADRLLTLSGCVLLAVTVVATLAAPLLIRLYAADGWDRVELGVATAFAYWCLPQIFFYGVYTMLGQVLNSRGIFGPYMWAPIVNNVIAIAIGGVFLAVATIDPVRPGTLSGEEIALLGGGTTLGVVLQAAVLVPALRRARYRFRPRFDWRGAGLGRAGGLAVWTAGFVAVNQLAYLVVTRTTTWVDDVAADTVPYGVGYTAYSYAHLVLMLPHSILTVSLVTALLPRMSAAAVEGNRDGVREDFSYGIRVVGVATVPAVAAFAVLGPELTTVLYAWGNTSPAGAAYIGRVLAAFAPGLLVFSAQYVVLRTFYAQEDTRTPFLLALPIAATQVVLALVARAVLPLTGVTIGIAAGYSLAYAVGLAVSLAVLRRRLGSLDGRRVVRTYVRVLLAGAVAGAAAWALAELAQRVPGPEVLGASLALAAGGLVLAVGYVALARRMRVRELDALLGAVQDRLRR
ncbi:MAG: murein biosynthesis integral membrane protein MurJ [Actinomycetota bacterium]|nr:murein biosynthesis integral membrane protein MurJ [Actinomycetota bacterium]